MRRRRICVVTATRAEYGLLRWILEEIGHHPQLELQLIATGSHLSAMHGSSIEDIRKDGFKIDAALDMLLATDSRPGAVKSLGVLTLALADTLSRLDPDIVVVLGDRYELLAVAASATIMGLPLAHIAGGHVTEGAIDDSIRHAITKLASVHFTSNETYARRIAQLGEAPDRIHVVGSTGVDAVRRLDFLDRAALEESIGYRLGKRNWLVTVHPETATQADIAGPLLEALGLRPDDEHFLFTMPNADPGNAAIRDAITRFVGKNRQRAIGFENLGQLRYLSLMRQVDGIIGNSSSALIEAPALQRPAINIGNRQKGRLLARSVLSCSAERDAILGAMDVAISKEFQAFAADPKSPYGDGHASRRIVDILARINLDGMFPKPFVDLPGPVA